MSSTGPVFQNSVYVGINLEDILYGKSGNAELEFRAILPLRSLAGVELVLYFKTMHVLLSSQVPRKKSDVFYAIFSTVMLFLITLWVSTQAVFGEEMWLVNAGYPGGPDAYWQENASVWYLDLGTTAVTILQLMTDALMVRHDHGWRRLC